MDSVRPARVGGWGPTLGNALETEVSSSLSAMCGIWYTKIPDIPRFTGDTFRASIPRPFDYITVSQEGVVAIECKQSRNATNFPLSNIRPQQITEMAHLCSLGLSAYFLINVRLTKQTPRSNRTFAITPEQIIEWYYQQSKRASIPVPHIEQEYIEVPRIKIPNTQKYGWDLRILPPLGECDFYRGEEPRLL